MRISFIFAIITTALLGLSGCKKAEEAADKAKATANEAADATKEAADKAGEAAGDAMDSAKEAVGNASRETYVKAAVAIGCLGKNEKDPAKLASESMDIQKKFGFDAKSWGEYAQKMANDPEAAKEIAKGLSECK